MGRVGWIERSETVWCFSCGTSPAAPQRGTAAFTSKQSRITR